MSERKHILVICFPAFGHYLPMLEFAKKAVQHHDVTITYSQERIPDLQRRNVLPPAPIQLLPLEDHMHMALDDGISDLKELAKMMKSTEIFYPDFCRNLPHGCNRPVDAVVCDNTFYCAFRSLQENQSLKAYYSFSCFPITLMVQRSMITEELVTVPDEEFFKAKGQMAGVPESIKTLAMNMNESMKYQSEIISSSFEELEPRAAVLLKVMMKSLNVRFVGPLLPLEEDHPDASVKKWMDGKEDRSVVYFSFGTVATVSAEQIAVIADALLSLQRPFIWSLRPAQQELLSADIQRTTDNYLILPWVPQKQVLAHKATAIFVSHCGWNSTLESLSNGIPIVAWPGFGDQIANAGLVERLDAGMLVKAGGKEEIIPAKDIVATIENVAGWNGNTDRCVQVARDLGNKAMAAIAADGKSTKNLKEILKEIN
ncbi:uncharacterized protein LOC129602035 [Paramacrobiotus metropolitanus]|uniref:uncharacterized protein LOC129602035 n=1 Tax=Paramacrobiotus metropolitanus TaxID=2943436 RepID=UPI002445B5CC|nr:uncharacterized protein LOC129602035 [Paramacrobiotus metropolitanus]